MDFWITSVSILCAAICVLKIYLAKSSPRHDDSVFPAHLFSVVVISLIVFLNLIRFAGPGIAICMWLLFPLLMLGALIFQQNKAATE